MPKNLDISGYLVKNFDAELRNENWRFDCPFCGADRQRFSVSIPKGVVHCWKCNYTNSLLGFVSDCESVSLGSAFRIIRKYLPITRPNRIQKPSKTKSSPTLPIRSSIIGYRNVLTVQHTLQGRMAYSYLKRRGLLNDDIKYWRLGLSDDEKLTGRIVIPFIEAGLLVYYIARLFCGGGAKYYNPSRAEWGIGKSGLLYNIDSASERRHSSISIVEGVFDCFTVGRHSVALLGKVASKIQIGKILSMNPSEINIQLDADAREEALDLAQIFGEIIPTKITFYKSGDPADNRATTDKKEEVRYSLKTLVESKLFRKTPNS